MTNNKVLIDALQTIAEWKLPEVNKFWDAEQKERMTFTAAYGTSGAKEYMMEVATTALTSHAKQAPPVIEENAITAFQKRFVVEHIPEYMQENFRFFSEGFKAAGGGQVTGKSAGANLIAKERAEQIEKHHRTIDHDVERNTMGELVMAATAILTAKDGQFPAGWDLTLVQKMCDKPYPERVVIAGAFLAAEYDRISADPHWGECIKSESGEAGKQPEQQPANTWIPLKRGDKQGHLEAGKDFLFLYDTGEIRRRDEEEQPFAIITHYMIIPDAPAQTEVSGEQINNNV